MIRNFDNILNQELREEIDPKYNNIHDELSDCYYKKKEFRKYGILDKQTFDKLHGLIFNMRDMEYNEKIRK
ncbi:MAG: hypothetical protein PHS54_01560 [Clostridia bacterium]|nr:hypothetical protein [Clostridia bacterium]